jgi:signal transduction histidine kinase
MEASKHEIAARLVQARAELEQALLQVEALPSFEAGSVIFAAHALNNYLTVTKASAHLLQLHLKNHPEPEVRTLIDGLIHTAEMMRGTIAKLLYGAERDDPQVRSRQVNPANLLRKLCDYYQQIADRKQIKIRCECDSVPLTLSTDGVVLAAVLDNLMSNAVKYTPRGKHIWARAADAGDAVVCRVQDEGPGISEEDQARLFQKGIRLSAVPTGGEPSIGYGLAVAKDLVAKLGGTIDCTSTLGSGAEFSVRIPKATGPA